MNLKETPNDKQLELKIISACFADKGNIHLFIDILDSSDFYDSVCSLIFKHIKILFNDDIVPNTDLVWRSINKNENNIPKETWSTLLDCTVNYESSAAAKEFCKIVKDLSSKRRLILLSHEVIAQSYNHDSDVVDILKTIDETVIDIVPIEEIKHLKHIKEVAETVLQDSIKANSDPNFRLGISTGFTDLDNIIYGLIPSDLIVVGARPGMGKTAFMLQLANNASKARKTVGIFSLEMSNDQLTLRLYSSNSGEDGHSIRRGTANFQLLEDAYKYLIGLDIVMNDNPALTIRKFKLAVKQMIRSYDIDVLMIDYLQLFSPEKGETANMTTFIGAISRECKIIAKSYDIPAVLLSQLSRECEKRSDKRPQMADLRSSGEIEQNADIIMFLYRAGYYGLTGEDGEINETETECIIAKHRNGSTGVVKLDFEAQFMRFTDIVEPEYVEHNDNPF